MPVEFHLAGVSTQWMCCPKCGHIQRRSRVDRCWECRHQFLNYKFVPAGGCLLVIDERPYKKCDNPLCDRQTTAMYCCGACATAHEDGFEIHEDGPLGHSTSCNDRHAERGPWKAHKPSLIL